MEQSIALLQATKMKKDILQLIKESKPLLKHASAEQKLKFLKLMKESMKLQNTQRRVVVMETPKLDADYIEEK